MSLTKQRSTGARARHALVKEIVMYVIGKKFFTVQNNMDPRFQV